MSGSVTSDVVIVAILFLRIACGSLAILLDNTLKHAHRRSLLLTNAIALSLVVMNWLAGPLVDQDKSLLATIALLVYVHAVYPVIYTLFLSVMDAPKSMRGAWMLTASNAVLYGSAFFCPLTFYVTSDNQLQRGPLSYAVYVVCALLLAQIIFLTVRDFRKQRKAFSLLPALGALIIAVGTLLDAELAFNNISSIHITTLVLPLVCDIFFVVRHFKIADEYERVRLEKQRNQLAVSQIQPHFLYNTLTTIQALCTVDPASAARTTEQFANYLRQNLDTLSQSGLIPFSKELEHTRTYAQIETTRFPNIEVSYRIEDADFMLPALSVQPLVENAIRHGVRVREHGLVCVTSRAERGFHVVEVRDNGKGFDVSTLAEQDNDEHIGIYNVRQRVRNMCGGELRIESVVDEGTCVSLRIPAKEDVA